MLVQVAVERRISDGMEQLTYQVPEQLASQIQWGSLVQVPLGRGNQAVRGYVTAFLQEEPGQWKPVQAVISADCGLSEELVQLALWLSGYYLCPVYYVLEFMLPKYARGRQQEMLVWDGQSALAQAQLLLQEEGVQQLAHWIREQERLPLSQLWKTFSDTRAHREALAQLEQLGLVHQELVLEQQGGERSIYIYESCIAPAQLAQAEAQLGRAVRQFEVLRYLTLEGASSASVLAGYWPNYHGLVKALLQKGLITRTKQRQERCSIDLPVFRNEKKLTLNQAQQQALEGIVQALERKTYRQILLHGVTGSGKTEVYLRTLRQVLEQGDGAMILVPEIALTPQLIGRFRAVLGEAIEVLHSNLSDGERYDAWQRLRRGETKVVVGVRSAVFAPVQRLRLIIMDEEHETTYKQSEPDPRYHAQVVARQRMQYNNGLLLLGSATPSVQTYYESLQHGTVLTMQRRAMAQPLPEVAVVDMAREFQSGNRSMFSQQLMQSMEDSLRRGEQVILFLNRRGFSSSVVCRECGYTLVCEKCSIAMTYHKGDGMAKCHYCDYRQPLTSRCPSCGSQFIRYLGSGTEQVEEALHKLWPWVQTERMDLDTTQTKEAHGAILERFARGETQVLIGTQMIAKGLDFPNVTTVGVLAADMVLNLPDYSAAERTFQLLTQVAGRAGRGEKPGQVIIQTYNPEHYSIVAAQQHDYAAFYARELETRRLLDYPPFSYLVRILLSDVQPGGMLEAMQQMADAIRQQFPEITMLGPAEAPISMIRRRHRFHLILKGDSLELLREAARYGQRFMNLSRKSKTLRFLIDVEPSSVL